MNFFFGQLIVYVVYSCCFIVGCIIGLGMVFNVVCVVGLVCIVEWCVIEKIDYGEICIGFMYFGDEVCMQVYYEDGSVGFFGIVWQCVVQVV